LYHKISIITICFNSSKTIYKTLESVSKQLYKNIEYIIIDGNSKDGTIDIVKDFHCVDKIVSEPDNGIYDAFNKGIKLSTGDIIGFLNSDDIFYNDNSLKIINEQFNDQIDCIFGDLIYTDSNNKIKRFWKGSPYKKGSFKKGWMPAHPTFYCKKSIYDKFGLYDESYKIAGDFELMLRFLEKHKIRSKYIPKNIVNMKVGGVSGGSIKAKFNILNEEFRAFEKNELSINKVFYLFHKLKKLKELRL
tara:strand:- start:4678 stop:5418 length:741 start_codon:yes stop_codon:yes gene_type:complete